MKRISSMTHEEIINYNLRDDGTAVSVFADTQGGRVERARMFVRAVLAHTGQNSTIWELGCSAGDISGWFSYEHDVTGIDIVPAAVELTRRRYPAMNVILGKAEDLTPQPCDLLVLCEFLEHITDPVGLVRAWLPLARFALIGHPLNDIGEEEPGHIWSFNLRDYNRWLRIGGHIPIETHLFSAPLPEMVMGVSRRR